MNGMTNMAKCDRTEMKESLVTRWCRSLVLRLVSGLTCGRLIVQEGEQQWHFGTEDVPCARLTVHDPVAYRKILFGGSIGAGEAYIAKLWDVDDLTAFIQIVVRNMALLDRMEKRFAWLTFPFDMIRHLFNSNNKRGAKRNILAHYDLGNDLYKTFLDESMMYSSAIYPYQGASLEEAQGHKLELICQKLELQPTDSVLEIGTGWGGFALYAAKHYGCHVTTTTISDAQWQEATARVAAEGLADKIELLRCDYRELSGKYDKLVSIEMIEAVGNSYLPGFFKKCCQLLKPEGKMVLQAITIADQRYKQYVRSVDFIRRYIFPGGCVVANSRMVQLLTDKTDMVVRQLDDFGIDYATTVADWRQRFLAARRELQQKGYDETFRRLWEFYLCYCEGAFLERSISVVHVVATRPAHRPRQ